MKITKKQLAQIIKEEIEKLFENEELKPGHIRLAGGDYRLPASSYVGTSLATGEKWRVSEEQPLYNHIANQIHRNIDVQPSNIPEDMWPHHAKTPQERRDLWMKLRKHIETFPLDHSTKPHPDTGQKWIKTGEK